MRPASFHIGGTVYWTLLTRDPDTLVLKDADSDPTVVVKKGNTVTGDSVTVTKRSATTGIYDCSYNPAGEVEGDKYTLEETADVTGTTTATRQYDAAFTVVAVAVERGTDSALTSLPAITAGWLTAAGIADGAITADKFAANALDAVWSTAARSLTTFGTLVADVATAVWSAVSRTITGTVTLDATQANYAPAKAGDAMTLTSGERSSVAAAVELAIFNEGDATALLAAIAAKVEEFLVNEGDATAVIAAIATACNAAVAAGTVGTNAATAATQATTAATQSTAAAASAAAVNTKLGTPAGASVSDDIAAVKVDTAAAVADTNELQTDWANGGRLDSLLDTAAAGGGASSSVSADAY